LYGLDAFAHDAPTVVGVQTHSTNDLDAVAAALNTRPRKTLGWKTPAVLPKSGTCAPGSSGWDAMTGSSASKTLLGWGIGC
jgi:hypothetical protein